MNSNLIEMIKRHEGSKKNKNGRHILYKCPADKWTCGYGRNAEDVGFSEDEVELMLQNDIKHATEMLKRLFNNFDDFSGNRQNALIDMMFNLGASRFLLFRKMIVAIKRDSWVDAANEAKDSKWYSQVTNRAKEIISLIREG